MRKRVKGKKTEKRKDEHIKICCESPLENITFSGNKTTLLECVELLPSDFPERNIDEIVCESKFLSRKIGAPFMVSAITGGSEKAGKINRVIASVCQEFLIPMEFGSGRAMIENPHLSSTFMVRNVAPDIPLIANIGIVQSGQLSRDEIDFLVRGISADALAIHINFAMESVQPEGGGHFNDVVETIQRVCAQVDFPVIVKEVGGGFTFEQLKRLKTTGAAWVDVAGAGGTSWVKIEAIRAGRKGMEIAEPFFNWGIPTAVSTIWARRAGWKNIIVSGGVRNGLEIAKCLALGGNICGIALPVLRIIMEKGADGLRRYFNNLVKQLRMSACVCGITSLDEFKKVGYLLKGELRQWIEG